MLFFYNFSTVGVLMNIQKIAVMFLVLGQLQDAFASSGMIRVVNTSVLKATTFCSARFSSTCKRSIDSVFESEVERCNHFIELLERRLRGEKVYKREVAGLHKHEKFFNPQDPKVNPYDAMNYWSDYKRILTSDS